MKKVNKSEQSRTKKTKEVFVDSMYKSLGVVSLACKNTDISRTTYYKWLKNDEDFKAKIEQIPETVLDFAESQLFKLIKEGNVPATIFFLKCKGKKRDYIERTETNNINEDTTINVVYQKADNNAVD